LQKTQAVGLTLEFARSRPVRKLFVRELVRTDSALLSDNVISLAEIPKHGGK
jgi:hypothetical protein